LTIIEENGRRYYKAYLADRLDGKWTPLADTAEKPFAGWKNIRPAAAVEEELGALLHELHRGHAPELEEEPWFSSFLSCLIMCERHFEEQARLGVQRATNRELIHQQWDRVLAAVDALDALIDL